MENNSRDDIPWVDGAKFNDNVNRFPEEELSKYWGQHVAWNLDGTQILLVAQMTTKWTRS